MCVICTPRVPFFRSSSSKNEEKEREKRRKDFLLSLQTKGKQCDSGKGFGSFFFFFPCKEEEESSKNFVKIYMDIWI